MERHFFKRVLKPLVGVSEGLNSVESVQDARQPSCSCSVSEGLNSVESRDDAKVYIRKDNEFQKD